MYAVAAVRLGALALQAQTEVLWQRLKTAVAGASKVDLNCRSETLRFREHRSSGLKSVLSPEMFRGQMVAWLRNQECWATLFNLRSQEKSKIEASSVGRLKATKGMGWSAVGAEGAAGWPSDEAIVLMFQWSKEKFSIFEAPRHSSDAVQPRFSPCQRSVT